MKVADIIRAPKSDVKVGAWKAGKIPNAAFPLGRALPYGGAWDWRTAEFCALGQKFRVLILLNEELEKYSAVMGMEHDRGLLVLCHHELHTSHKRWHCHFISGSIWETFPNVLRDRDRMVGWPKGPDSNWTDPFPVNKDNALTLAAQRFRFEEQGGLC